MSKPECRFGDEGTKDFVTSVASACATAACTATTGLG